MCFLNSGNTTELLSQIVKAFFICFSCHTIIHISPLSIFAFRCMEQVFGSVTKLAESLKPQFRMFLFIFGSLQEKCCNLLEACLLCNRSKVCILVSCLRFACKCFPKVLFGLGTGIGILGFFLKLYEFFFRLFANRTVFRRSISLVNMTAYGAFPFCHFRYLFLFYIFIEIYVMKQCFHHIRRNIGIGFYLL